MPVERRRTAEAAAGWLLTRVLLYLIIVGTLLTNYTTANSGDVATYAGWVRTRLEHGVIPSGSTWQYPPLVGPLLLLPKLLPGNYLHEFVLLALIADAAITALLVLMARRRGTWYGPWFWIAGAAVLGPIVLGRFDVFSALPLVGALVLFGRGALTENGLDLNARRWWAGALVGLGLAIKLWPGLAFFGLPRSRRGAQAFAAGVGTALGVTLICLAAFKGGGSFVSNQGSRGVEIESVWAMPFLVVKTLGLWHGKIKLQYGSFQLVGSGVGIFADLALLCTVAGFALMGLWWWRRTWRPALIADATFVATLIMVMTSRVISPQYLVWLLAVGAICVMSRDTTQRRSCILFLIALPFTALEYPYLFWSLWHAHAIAVAVVVVRDLLLLAATGIGFVDLWRGSVQGPVLARKRPDTVEPALDPDRDPERPTELSTPAATGPAAEGAR